MSDQRNVFIIGPMGAGKSAVGRQLARRLNQDFHDSDSEIEARTGVDIPFIFEKEGEAGFRRREQKVIDELTRFTGIVLATGGGVVGDESNRSALTTRGLVVYLHASVDQQMERTRYSSNRPLLDGDNPRERLESLMTEREPLYRSLADYVVNTDGRRVPDVTDEIRRWLNASLENQ
jgi:shikimate kinase